MCTLRPMPDSSWRTALVTGASSGIGEQMARRLAAGGSDLVVVARDEERLRSLADQCAEQHSIDVEVLAADLADREALGAVEGRLRDVKRPVDLLVNNAGFGVNGDVAEVDVDELTRMIDVNVTALVRLTSAALPGMLARDRGTILNVSSLASFQPAPGFASYSASKAFVTSFTESLHEELRGTGVRATAVCPGFTSTEFQARAGGSQSSRFPSALWQTAEEVAAESLAAAARGRAVAVTGSLNRVLAGVSGPVPRSVKRRVVGRVARRL